MGKFTEAGISAMGEVHVSDADGEWTTIDTPFEDELLAAMTKPILDTETKSVQTWGHSWGWTNPDYKTVEEIVDEKTGGHMAKRASTHADPKMEDGVWICRACNSESMDRQMFEEAGEWEECAKNHTKEATGEEKDALGRYVAGAEAKQNFDRATKAIQEFKAGMEKLGLAAADMTLVMKAVTGEIVTDATPEDVARLSKNFPELKPTLETVKFPQEVLDKLKPIGERQWHKELMKTLDRHYTWSYICRYTVADRVGDFVGGWMDAILRRN